MRKIEFEDSGFEDVTYWIKADPKKLKKIIELLDDVRKNPFSGLGKPEPLKHEFQGCWSRRIDDEHCLVYSVSDESITVISCRYHYA